MKVLFSQQISNHPNNPLVTRHVDLMATYINGFHDDFEIHFKVREYNGENPIPYERPVIEKINNNRTMLVRDENFEPIPNPGYDEETMDESEEFLTAPAFDYLTEVLFTSPQALSIVVGAHIAEMDVDGKFN